MDDLFYRRVEMAEILFKSPPEVMKNIDLTEWYPEFWRLVGESYRKTKFHAQEKLICQQMALDATKEENFVRQQYFALAFLVFGDFQAFSKLANQNYWSAQLKKDFSTFVKWDSLVNSPLTPNARNKIANNREILSFLQNKYADLIKNHAQAPVNEKICPPVSQNDYQIYFCWLQGEKNLPPVVQCCYNSLKQNAGHYKILFLDQNNFSNYVELAPHVLNKFRAGKISLTHFSDVIRINLLEKYGGLWLDSTILVTEPLENHQNLWEMPFFTQKFLHKVDYRHFQNNLLHYCVSYGRWAGFIQGSAILHNPIFAFKKDFYNEYWRDFDEVIDYNLMDFMMCLAYENIPFARKEIDAVPINNPDVWVLMNSLGKNCSEVPLDEVLANNFLHKLDWRGKPGMFDDGSVFREIQRRYSTK